MTLLSTAIIFVAVYRGTGDRLRSEIDQEIAADARELAHHLESSGGAHTRRSCLPAATRYVKHAAVRASSTLLLVRVPGAGATTNQPELFSHAAARRRRDARPSRTRRTGSPGKAADGADGYLDGARSRTSATCGCTSSPCARRHGLLGDGRARASRSSSVAHAQRGVARAFILAALLGLGGALIASLLIASRVSRPLRRMAGVAATGGRAETCIPRMHHERREGEEVKVLTDSFNHMLDRLSDAFDGQRAFVADASHELRTPLTVIRGQIEVLASQARPRREEVRRVARLVQAEIARVTRLVDDLLLLAKSEQGEFLRAEPIDLSAVRERSCGTA